MSVINLIKVVKKHLTVPVRILAVIVRSLTVPVRSLAVPEGEYKKGQKVFMIVNIAQDMLTHSSQILLHILTSFLPFLSHNFLHSTHDPSFLNTFYKVLMFLSFSLSST